MRCLCKAGTSHRHPTFVNRLLAAAAQPAGVVGGCAPAEPLGGMETNAAGLTCSGAVICSQAHFCADPDRDL